MHLLKKIFKEYSFERTITYNNFVFLNKQMNVAHVHTSNVLNYVGGGVFLLDETQTQYDGRQW